MAEREIHPRTEIVGKNHGCSPSYTIDNNGYIYFNQRHLNPGKHHPSSGSRFIGKERACLPHMLELLACGHRAPWDPQAPLGNPWTEDPNSQMIPSNPNAIKRLKPSSPKTEAGNIATMFLCNPQVACKPPLTTGIFALTLIEASAICNIWCWWSLTTLNFVSSQGSSFKMKEDTYYCMVPFNVAQNWQEKLRIIQTLSKNHPNIISKSIQTSSQHLKKMIQLICSVSTPWLIPNSKVSQLRAFVALANAEDLGTARGGGAGEPKLGGWLG